jgi:hypothetical protein
MVQVNYYGKTMTKINVITPPDVLHNQATSFLLIQPTSLIRQQFQILLQSFDQACNVYLYDPQTDEERNYDWLLNISRMVDYNIIDLDNMGYIEKNLASYLISLPNSFYLTNDEYTPYNMISVNRIYDLDWLHDKLKEESHE